MGPGVSTGSAKHPNQTVSEDWVGIQRYKFGGNDLPSGSNHIGDIIRGAWKK